MEKSIRLKIMEKGASSMGTWMDFQSTILYSILIKIQFQTGLLDEIVADRGMPIDMKAH